MKLQFSTLAGTTALMGAAALLILLTGCDTEGSGRVTLYGGSTGYAQSSVSFEDDYDYYPGYEVYYSRNRREYVYRDGDQWVRRSEPRDVSINVLLAMPSIRLDFHDSPERQHDNVVRR